MNSSFRKPIMLSSGLCKDCILLQQQEPKLNSYEFCVIVPNVTEILTAQSQSSTRSLDVIAAITMQTKTQNKF